MDNLAGRFLCWVSPHRAVGKSEVKQHVSVVILDALSASHVQKTTQQLSDARESLVFEKPTLSSADTLSELVHEKVKLVESSAVQVFFERYDIDSKLRLSGFFLSFLWIKPFITKTFPARSFFEIFQFLSNLIIERSTQTFDFVESIRGYFFISFRISDFIQYQRTSKVVYYALQFQLCHSLAIYLVCLSFSPIMATQVEIFL